jgi:hypothetical protein
MFHSEFLKPIAASQNVAIGAALGGAGATGKGPGEGEPQKCANLTLSPLRRSPRFDAESAFIFVQPPLSWGW